jgi:autotransporter-associated beta strand protein
MKQISPIMMRAFVGIIASVIIGLASSAYAADGTWTNLTSGGLWGNTANWQDGTIADNSGFTANFNTLNITSDNTAHLDSDRTLTSLIFGDTTTSSAGGWLLDNNGGSTNNLILAGTTPTITVNALGSGKSATITAIIEGSAGLVKDGAGTLSLSGINTFSGGLFVKAGTVTLSSGNGTSTVGGNGSITLGDGGATSATLSLGSGTSGTTYNNPIILNGSSAAQLSVITGAASVSLSGVVSGTGNLTINDSRSDRAMSVNGASVNHVGSISNASSASSTVNISSVIGSNVTSVIQNGATVSKLVISGANTNFIGDTTVTSGNLDLTNTRALQKSVLIMNGGTITFGPLTAVTLGGLSGSGNINLPTSINLAFGNSNASYGGNTLNPTYSGVLSGSASLTKVGTNTQTFAGANTYSGGTTVSNGTLWASNTSGSGTGTGAVNVEANATLGGIGMITGLVTVANGGILSPGTNSVGSLTVGSLRLNANATFAIQITGAGSNNWCVVSTGTVDIASSSLSIAVSPGYTPKFNTTFTIIRNVKADAVIGTFANGTRITPPGLTMPFEIDYTGGVGGHDVVLRYTGGGATVIRLM